jgi:hypothetical protein
MAVQLSAGYAYVADASSGLRVLNVGDPAHPALAAYYDTPHSAYAAHVAAGRAYIADWGCGLQIVEPTLGVAGRPTHHAPRITPHAAVVRGVLNLPAFGVQGQAPGVLLDAAGRRVMDLREGGNDVSRLAPGVYFVRFGAANSRLVVAR